DSSSSRSVFAQMRIILSLFFLALAWPAQLPGAIPPAERLLPQETILLLSIPDCVKARSSFSQANLIRLCHDPVMKGFRYKFKEKVESDVVGALERELGITFSNYTELAQGQFTFALLPENGPEKTNHIFNFLLLVDAKDKTDQLRKNLSDLKKKWIDAGK